MQLLEYFVKSVCTLYGCKWLHYNNHAMLHADDAASLKSLDAFSEKKKKNHLDRMKKMVCSGKHPFVKILNRIDEIDTAAEQVEVKTRDITWKPPHNHYVLSGAA